MRRLLEVRSLAVVLVGLGVTVAVLAMAVPVSAHDNTSGSVALTIDDRRVISTGPVRFTDIGLRDTSGDGLIGADEVAAQEAAIAPTLVDRVRRHVDLDVDGRAATIIGAGLAIDETNRSVPSKFVPIVFATGPHDGDVSTVDIVWSFSSPSDEVVLSHADGVIVRRLGAGDAASFTLEPGVGASSFFRLGIDHIRFGPDHLLFLVVLTLAAAGTAITKASTWRTVKLVTAFTAGHAISLALAYFDVISVPAGLVEPAISLSIVASAVVVMRGRSRAARPWIAGLIGLVHGLGFASSLAALGVSAPQRVPALAAFNVGIDIAQTAVVLMIVAVLLVASRGPVDRMAWVRVPTAAVAAVIGLVWTASRLPGVAA